MSTQPRTSPPKICKFSKFLISGPALFRAEVPREDDDALDRGGAPHGGDSGSERLRVARAPRDVAAVLRDHAGGAVGRRRRMNKWMKSRPNFERLVLSSIEADFCKPILVWKLLMRSTRFIDFRIAPTSKC